MELSERIKKVIAVIPKEYEDLITVLESNLQSVLYSPPENGLFWARQVAQNLENQIPIPPKEEWQFRVFEEWTEKDRSELFGNK